MLMERPRFGDKLGDIPILNGVPSKEGVNVYEGGFGPAPSNVTTTAWRARGCAGVALAVSRTARRIAAEMVKSFIAKK